MNEFLGTSPWTAITKDVARKRRGPVVAAISYVGVSAAAVLPLRKGDFLICDASERAIKQGVTSAKSLASYLRNGVKVFSHEGLHSKVVATESFAWVGSANASRNSRDNLTEASIRIEGPACRDAYRWAESLAAEDIELSMQDVQVLAKLPVSWQARGGEPGRVSKSMKWPTGLSRLVILGLGAYDVSAAEQKAFDKHRVEVRKSLSVQSSQLECFVNKKPLPIKEGEWFIPVFGNRVGTPCRLERRQKLPNFEFCWYAQAKTPTRLRIADLRSLVSGVEESFNYCVVKDRLQIAKIFKHYGDFTS
jgi:hypothetical protein